MTEAAVETPTVEPSVPRTRDPAAFSLQTPPPRVTRLSRRALTIAGVALGSVVGGSLIYGLQHRHSAEPAANVYNGDGATKAEAVTGEPADYASVPKLGQPMPGDLGGPILSARANGQTVPVPPIGPQAVTPDPQSAAREQGRQRVAQERDSARTSRLFLGGGNATGEAVGSASPTPIASAELPGPVAAVPPAETTNAGQTGRRAFLKVAADRPTESVARVTAPTSPYVVQAGSVIPAALITGIRSDLPGQITAQVTQNVYDSPTGRILLIPQGARLVGEYDSEVSSGQNRVLLAWDRLIFPDGRSILLDRQTGTDAAGFAGLQDRTNFHWGNMLKAAFVSTLLGVGTELTTQGDSELIRALRYGTQDTSNQTGRQVVQRQLAVPPTLTVRPGYPLRVLITRDLVLEPAGEQR